MYISTSYYRLLVQELRVFRPQNAPNSVPCNLAANSDQHAGVGRNSALAGSSHCTEYRGGTRSGTRLQLDPFLTRLTTLASAAALRRVVPEFRVNLLALNRVAEF